VDITEGKHGCRVEAAYFLKMSQGSSSRLSHLVFALFCLKADEPLWSRKLWRKSYVFQSKTEM